jgi:hypothetical protein
MGKGLGEKRGETLKNLMEEALNETRGSGENDP